ALVPDLNHGEPAEPTERDKAEQLMNELPPARAARDMSGAVDFLAGHEAVTGDALGVVGFCMGGMLSWLLACNRPDKVKAVVSFYGVPQGEAEPDWARLDGPGRGRMAANDKLVRPEGR